MSPSSTHPPTHPPVNKTNQNNDDPDVLAAVVAGIATNGVNLDLQAKQADLVEFDEGDCTLLPREGAGVVCKTAGARLSIKKSLKAERANAASVATKKNGTHSDKTFVTYYKGTYEPRTHPPTCCWRLLHSPALFPLVLISGRHLQAPRVWDRSVGNAAGQLGVWCEPVLGCQPRLHAEECGQDREAHLRALRAWAFHVLLSFLPPSFPPPEREVQRQLISPGGGGGGF